MENSEKTFQLLEVLESQEVTTQRQLSELAGISLGQVNYILKSLLEKGLVKIGNFRKNPHKIGYAYLLTPKGIEARSRLAVNFIISRLKEYQRLKQRLTEKLAKIENKGRGNILFVGPTIMKDFLDSTIREKHQNLTLVGHCRNWKQLINYEHDSFDIALLFDDDTEGIRELEKTIGISPEKVFPLW